jgi:ABC-2 type transport system ATP-binding protein
MKRFTAMKGVNISNINKSYGKKQVLFDVSLSVSEGSIFGLIGPSGCGKTTLVRIVAGLQKQDSGEIEILGSRMPSKDIIPKIGYMAQAAALYKGLTGRENLSFFGKLFGLKGKELDERISYVTSLVGLEKDIDANVENYSGGMSQRLSLATALIHEPSVLLLDEPTVGIDPVLRSEIWDELHKLASQGVTILITTHVMDEAEKCDCLAMLREGMVLATGSAKELIEKAGTSNFEDAFITFGKSL